MAFFSIIIPVYNVEKYLIVCVESVLKQTFGNFEVILVNDGSTDGSGALCDEICKADSRVKVIHKKNGGLSSARNMGIKNSKGEYILFLDSDDYWNDEKALDKLYIETKKQPDIINFGATLLFPTLGLVKDGFQLKNEYFQGNKVEVLRELICSDKIVGSVCTKAVKRDFLEKNELWFREGIRSEDIEWLLRMSIKLPSISYMDNHFYIYRQNRDGSISNIVGQQHLKEYYKIICDFINDDTIRLDIKKALTHYVAYQYAILCALTVNADFKGKYSYIREYKNNKELFKYTAHPKMKKVGIVYRLLGYYPTVFLLGIYLKRKK